MLAKTRSLFNLVIASSNTFKSTRVAETANNKKVIERTAVIIRHDKMEHELLVKMLSVL